jgi:hypothetical protein
MKRLVLALALAAAVVPMTFAQTPPPAAEKTKKPKKVKTPKKPKAKKGEPKQGD